MALTETTTSPATCQTDGCEAEQEIGVRLLRGGGGGLAEVRLCVADATRSYDAIDPNRRGGRIELFDI